MAITKSMEIEELVQEVSGAVSYLSKNGTRCIRCGEPIWRTLEEAAREKGFGEDDIRRFVDDLNKLSGTEK